MSRNDFKLSVPRCERKEEMKERKIKEERVGGKERGKKKLRKKEREERHFFDCCSYYHSISYNIINCLNFFLLLLTVFL